MHESPPDPQTGQRSVERFAGEELRSLPEDWSENQRKAVTVALALQMRDMAEKGGADYRQTLFAASDRILQILTQGNQFLQDNRDYLLRGLDEARVAELLDELNETPAP